MIKTTQIFFVLGLTKKVLWCIVSLVSTGQFLPTNPREVFSMNAPRNTAANPLLNALAGMEAHLRTGNSSNMVLEQEAQGQKELVNSEVLPTKINSPRDVDVKAKLTELGFKFGNVVDGDPLFQEVTLPAGWKKVATDHSMWSKVVDDQGRERISIFYKAAFYDRDAFMSVTLNPA